MRWLHRLPLPTLCAVCRTWGDSAVCPSCCGQYARLLPRCPQCALPLAPGLALCIRCTEAGPGALAQCVARVSYEWPWVDWVAQFKFRSQPAWAHALAQLMLQNPQAHDLLTQADGLIPIPLSPARQAERGYNQAWELALELQRASGLPALPAALLHRDTRQVQHELGRAARLAHAQQAFAVNPSQRSALTGRHWVLVDDVLTTGATLQAAARHLLDAGALRVSALVFARTPAPLHGGDAAQAEALLNQLD
ncbi:MAG: ComF family protein [Serpentinimonas sp.]|nr:ComF family protein [Serpentinimonas sp.]